MRQCTHERVEYCQYQKPEKSASAYPLKFVKLGSRGQDIMSNHRQVTRPLVARKRNGGRLDLILIDSGRTFQVVGTDASGGVLLSYNDAHFVADHRDIGTRTVPVESPVAAF